MKKGEGGHLGGDAWARERNRIKQLDDIIKLGELAISSEAPLEAVKDYREGLQEVLWLLYARKTATPRRRRKSTPDSVAVSDISRSAAHRAYMESTKGDEDKAGREKNRLIDETRQLAFKDLVGPPIRRAEEARSSGSDSSPREGDSSACRSPIRGKGKDKGKDRKATSESSEQSEESLLLKSRRQFRKVRNLKQEVKKYLSEDELEGYRRSQEEAATRPRGFTHPEMARKTISEEILECYAARELLLRELDENKVFHAKRSAEIERAMRRKRELRGPSDDFARTSSSSSEQAETTKIRLPTPRLSMRIRRKRSNTKGKVDHELATIEDCDRHADHFDPLGTLRIKWIEKNIEGKAAKIQALRLLLTCIARLAGGKKVILSRTEPISKALSALMEPDGEERRFCRVVKDKKTFVDQLYLHSISSYEARAIAEDLCMRTIGLLNKVATEEFQSETYQNTPEDKQRSPKIRAMLDDSKKLMNLIVKRFHRSEQAEHCASLLKNWLHIADALRVRGNFHDCLLIAKAFKISEKRIGRDVIAYLSDSERALLYNLRECFADTDNYAKLRAEMAEHRGPVLPPILLLVRDAEDNAQKSPQTNDRLTFLEDLDRRLLHYQAVGRRAFRSRRTPRTAICSVLSGATYKTLCRVVTTQNMERLLELYDKLAGMDNDAISRQVRHDRGSWTPRKKKATQEEGPSRTKAGILEGIEECLQELGEFDPEGLLSIRWIKKSDMSREERIHALRAIGSRFIDRIEVYDEAFEIVWILGRIRKAAKSLCRGLKKEQKKGAEKTLGFNGFLEVMRERSCTPEELEDVWLLLKQANEILESSVSNKKKINGLRILQRELIRHVCELPPRSRDLPEVVSFLHTAISPLLTAPYAPKGSSPKNITKINRLRRTLGRRALKEWEINALVADLTQDTVKKFGEIEPFEFFSGSFNNEPRDLYRSPHIMEFGARDEKMLSLVSGSILQHTTPGMRANALNNWMRVAFALQNCGNFQDSCSIFTALNAHPVSRLRQTREKLDQKDQDALSRLEKDYDYAGHHKRMRQLSEDFHGFVLLSLFLRRRESVNTVAVYPDDPESQKTYFSALHRSLVQEQVLSSVLFPPVDCGTAIVGALDDAPPYDEDAADKLSYEHEAKLSQVKKKG